MEKKNEKVFQCYSPPMRDFFTSKGIRYELVGLNPRTLKPFWVYTIDEKVKVAMNEWSK